MGGGQNEGNYGIEVIAKPTGLYQIQKLKNLIFYILGGFGGAKGVGNGVNEGNYELEVLPKTPYLYHFSKLRNLIFLYFGGFWRVLVEFVVLF